MQCIAVYHLAFEDLGSFARPIREQGYAVSYRHAGTEALSLEEWIGAELVVVLGGPLGANDTGAYPWMRDELAGLHARLARGLPTLGICLGAQLIARAMGGSVHGRPRHKEIAWRALDLAGSPSVLEPMAGVPVLHWHGDNIALPPGMYPLASTPGTPCQAFALGNHILGLQFHAEFEGGQLEAWLAGHAVELAGAGLDLDRLRTETMRHAAGLAHAGAALARRWLGGLPAPVAGAVPFAAGRELP